MDRSTIMKLRMVARQGALDALAASRPGVRSGSGPDPELVAAKAEIYMLINRLKANGAAILIVSSELPEVLGICDQVLVMRRGSIAAAFDPRAVETSQARVFDVASGG